MTPSLLTPTNLPRRVELVDVGPRDGLQNEATHVPTDVKVALIERLQAAGVAHVEATSFVSPKWVPQMADAADVMARVTRRPGLRYSVLTPNMKGFEGALAAQAHEVVVFGATSETFSQKNINCSVTESMERFAPVVAAAHAHGMTVRGAISCALGCPYEGATPPERVGWVAGLMKDIGVDHVTVADTIGVGTPLAVVAALQAVLAHYPLEHISGHFHDTYGQALSNTLAALTVGVSRFDTAIAGLGGCPYAKGATGNVATEDVVFMLHGMGIETGLNLDALMQASQFISQHLGRPPQSRVTQAWLRKQAAQVCAG